MPESYRTPALRPKIDDIKMLTDLVIPEILAAAIRADINAAMTTHDYGSLPLYQQGERIADAIGPEIQMLYRLIGAQHDVFAEILKVCRGEHPYEELIDATQINAVEAWAKFGTGEINSIVREQQLNTGHGPMRFVVHINGVAVYSASHMNVTLGMVMQAAGLSGEQAGVDESRTLDQLRKAWKQLFALNVEDVMAKRGQINEGAVRIEWSGPGYHFKPFDGELVIPTHG